MSNRALWDVRKRHVWLATPLKRTPMKRRERLRNGSQAALDRKAPPQEPKAPDTEN